MSHPSQSPHPQTIAQKVAAAGVTISDDALVNFGSMARQMVDPSQRFGFPVESYWFRYGDIKSLTLAQVQLAIAGGAFANLPGGANVMRVSALPMSQFTKTPPTSAMGIDEYIVWRPVPVQHNIAVV